MLRDARSPHSCPLGIALPSSSFPQHPQSQRMVSEAQMSGRRGPETDRGETQGHVTQNLVQVSAQPTAWLGMEVGSR